MDKEDRKRDKIDTALKKRGRTRKKHQYVKTARILVDKKRPVQTCIISVEARMLIVSGLRTKSAIKHYTTALFINGKSFWTSHLIFISFPFPKSKIWRRKKTIFQGTQMHFFWAILGKNSTADWVLSNRIRVRGGVQRTGLPNIRIQRKFSNKNPDSRPPPNFCD